MTRKLHALALTAVLTACGYTAPAHAQFGSSIVFDPTNYGQNVLTAARELQQINNEIQQIQNQVTMIQNMANNLSSLNFSTLPGMTSALNDVGGLMNAAGGMGFTLGGTNSAFTQSYPLSYPLGTTSALLATDAATRWQQAMQAFQQTLQIQAQIAQNVQTDTASLSSLVTASQGAVGNLQVQQAGNQLLGLSTKQQLQIQNLMAAQYRATALEEARQAEEEEEGQAELQTFLGTSSAYTPD
jgi:P-type conjugative transfer protein TrbJ